MKKLILSTLVGVAMVLVPAAAAAAMPSNSSETIVTGVVTNDGNPLAGANVKVTCDGNVLTDTTDPTGSYQVTYSPISLCTKSSDAVVSATKGNLEGSDSAPVSGITNKINLAVVNVSAVPEFGLATGASAAVIGGGALLAVRRRSLRANQQ